MGESEQQVFDGFAAEQGEAKYGLCRNAANAARYARRNSILLTIITVLLLTVVAQNYAAGKAKNKRDNFKEQAKVWKAIAKDDPSPLVRLQNAGFNLDEIILINYGQQINILDAATEHGAFTVVAWCVDNCGCRNDSDI